jgi:hypothetical protein
VVASGALQGASFRARRLSREASLAPTRMILISTHAEQDYADLITVSPVVGFLPKSALPANAIRDLINSHDDGHPARSFHDPIGGLGIRSQPLSEDDPAGAWMSREEEATIATLYTILKRPWVTRWIRSAGLHTADVSGNSSALRCWSTCPAEVGGPHSSQPVVKTDAGRADIRPPEGAAFPWTARRAASLGAGATEEGDMTHLAPDNVPESSTAGTGHKAGIVVAGEVEPLQEPALTPKHHVGLELEDHRHNLPHEAERFAVGFEGDRKLQRAKLFAGVLSELALIGMLITSLQEPGRAAPVVLAVVVAGLGLTMGVHVAR